MKVIFGLGNPGKEFEKTRHNLGFLIVDHFAKKNDFPKFKLSKKFNSLISEKILNKEKIILAKPQTFMNNSGEAAKKMIEYYKIELKNFFVIHDDFDLPFGKIRICFGRGSAGHKGVQSIIEKLKTKGFVRFRIGIRPHNPIKKPLRDFVLEQFNKKEKKILKKVFEKVSEALKTAIKEEVEKAMQEFNKN